MITALPPAPITTRTCPDCGCLLTACGSCGDLQCRCRVPWTALVRQHYDRDGNPYRLPSLAEPIELTPAQQRRMAIEARRARARQLLSNGVSRSIVAEMVGVSLGTLQHEIGKGLV